MFVIFYMTVRLRVVVIVILNLCALFPSYLPHSSEAACSVKLNSTNFRVWLTMVANMLSTINHCVYFLFYVSLFKSSLLWKYLSLPSSDGKMPCPARNEIMRQPLNTYWIAEMSWKNNVSFCHWMRPSSTLSSRVDSPEKLTSASTRENEKEESLHLNSWSSGRKWRSKRIMPIENEISYCRSFRSLLVVEEHG